MRTRALTGTTHVYVCAVCLPVRVYGGTTSSVGPPRTRTGGRMALVQTWAVPIGAHALFPVLGGAEMLCSSLTIHTVGPVLNASLY